MLRDQFDAAEQFTAFRRGPSALRETGEQRSGSRVVRRYRGFQETRTAAFDEVVEHPARHSPPPRRRGDGDLPHEEDVLLVGPAASVDPDAKAALRKLRKGAAGDKRVQLKVTVKMEDLGKPARTANATVTLR